MNVEMGPEAAQFLFLKIHKRNFRCCAMHFGSGVLYTEMKWFICLCLFVFVYLQIYTVVSYTEHINAAADTHCVCLCTCAPQVGSYPLPPLFCTG